MRIFTVVLLSLLAASGGAQAQRARAPARLRPVMDVHKAKPVAQPAPAAKRPSAT